MQSGCIIWGNVFFYMFISLLLGKSSLDAGGFAEESGIVLGRCLAAPRQIASQAVSARCHRNQNFCPPSGSNTHLQVRRAPRSAATWVDVIFPWQWAGLHNFRSGLQTVYHYISTWISETPLTFILELVVSFMGVVCIILCTNLP